MIRINLLPVRVSRKKQAGRQQLAIMAGVLVAVFACNFGWTRIRAADLAARERKVQSTRAAIAQLERIIGEVKTIKAQQAAVKDKLAVLDKLKAGRQGPVRVLDELATIVPKKLWLRKFDEKAGAVTIDGTAETIDDVSLLLTALKQSRHFTSAELRKTSAKGEGRQKLVEFTITASVNYTPNVQIAAAAPGPAGADKR
jgi:type IV pilus assembly protein PilN